MGRRKPFTGKKKKAQLKERRRHKREQAGNEEKKWQNDWACVPLDKDDIQSSLPASSLESPKPIESDIIIDSLGRMETLASTKGYTPDKRTFFQIISKQEKEAAKVASRRPLPPFDPAILHLKAEDCTLSDSIQIPIRPEWDNSMSKEEVESREREAFESWLQNIYDSYSIQKMNFFEHNLEVWRQLWRTVEQSDILLLVVDSRNPFVLFPAAFYRLVTEQFKKPMILILNKMDLIPADVLASWSHFFLRRYPNICIVPFTSHYTDSDTQSVAGVLNRDGSERNKKSRRKAKKIVKGADQLLSVIHKLVTSGMDKCILWNKLIDRLRRKKSLPTDFQIEQNIDAIEEKRILDDIEANLGINFHCGKHQITLGAVGNPNVGKSSLLNALNGRVVLSVSKTPGHTKHFQHIQISPGFRLMDCPGLVFPEVNIPRQLQILSGVYPIAQVSEPYSSVMYLAELVDLVQWYSLPKPSAYSKSDPWSAWMICESFAEQHGFYTAQAGRADVYRAANHILRDMCEGRIPLYFLPPIHKAQK